ncbi:TetR/AcrR family transcriptional regulator [Mycobacterium sp. E2479]|uniref:TetR/AcrR family transcriptional regulator n=1 Tax=Mycobacterium sp. E2479 TaxID=1834134 RepID=UPI0007FE748C|nr:TetR/AcrR family transcriptional regulator [Mycobacterium sp. E2479]OBH49269.1 TetR family transcriptional regulator [Mycobacterium sp. E2479]
MRSHGWSGDTPKSDEEAISRILDAADEIISERGSAMRIADVARSLGVTRQTVYRYFPGTEALLIATAMRTADGFLDQLAAHAQGHTDPVAAVVEGLAFAIESLSADSQVTYLLNRQKPNGETAASITSDTALTFGREMLHRFDVDWEEHGFTDEDLDEMNEFCLRVLHSFLIDDNKAPRRAAELRRFLTRWVGPAITYPYLIRAIGGLTAAKPKKRSRRPAAS